VLATLKLFVMKEDLKTKKDLNICLLLFEDFFGNT